MKGLGLKLLKIHLLFLAFLPLFIDRSRDGKNGTKTRENHVLVQMCAPVQTIPRRTGIPVGCLIVQSEEVKSNRLKNIFFHIFCV